jgi:HD-GYP domain-containing protein (c-di-GMP phosphodiesterase class II)
MSSLLKSPADLFQEAKSLDARLTGLSLEYDLGEAALLVKGNRRILFYAYDPSSAKLKQLHEQAVQSGDGIVILLPDTTIPAEVNKWLQGVPHFDYIEPPFEPLRIARHIAHVITSIKWEDETRLARHELHASRERLKEIQQIGIALSAERDLDSLLSMIVEKARLITHADAGSLYIVEGDDEATGLDTRRLRFKISQNDSITVPFSEFTMPIGTGSIAGYVAYTSDVLNLSDVYHLPDETPFSFNRSFDEKFQYRSKSMLVVPMNNRHGDLIGVLQLINRKKDPQVKLTPEITDYIVHEFSPADVEVVEALASAAAVSLENAFLYEEIHRLFQGFVVASVSAIESRDKTTSGHSSRVASLTVGLAEKVDRLANGPLKEVKFSRQQLREIEYASLLHDFGKIGVPEQVLVKADKLYPADFQLVEARFKYIKKALEADFLFKQNQMLLEKGKRASVKALREFEEAYRREVQQLDHFMEVVREANRPSILAEGNFEALQEMAKKTFRDLDGVEKPILTETEVLNLSLPKGSLNEEERLKIERHVSHTYEFLRAIPWTKELRNIPRIAYMHHEKLNGKGYPQRVAAQEIPLQSRMMTISDIYDALTASDRPYKKAVPREKALDIISYEVKEGLLDQELFQVFVESEVYKLTA